LPSTLSALIEITAETGEAAGAILDRLVAKELRRIAVARERQAMRKKIPT
jgi:hypothetical protein